jgi:hypothetical protein
MEPKVPLFDIVNDHSRATAPLFALTADGIGCQANGGVAGLCAHQFRSDVNTQSGIPKGMPYLQRV